jgi:TolB-like protein/DNA-binding winged helix-turn-helix (wHTH) protein
MASDPAQLQQSIRFGEGYELDLCPRRLRHGTQVLKLERIPFEILLLLLERRDEIVTRDQIVSRVWGQDVFLDTDNSIRGAIRKLRQVLKDDAETPRFIQTVTGRGYRLIAPVITPNQASAASEPEASVVSTGDQNFVSELDGWLQPRRLRVVEQHEDRAAEGATPTGTAHSHENRKNYKSLLVGTVALLSLACLLAVWGWRRASRPPTLSNGKVVLAVLPFENLSRDPEQEFFSDGLTEEMIAQVGKLNRDRLAVVSRSAVAKYKGSNLSAKEIGRELDADYLVQGSVRRGADRVRVTVQLIQAQTQTDLWTESYDREFKDLLAVQDSVVQSIASQIHIALSDDQKIRLASPRQSKPEAYEAYLKGRYYWTSAPPRACKRRSSIFSRPLTAIQPTPRHIPGWPIATAALCGTGSNPRLRHFRRLTRPLAKRSSSIHNRLKPTPRWAWCLATIGIGLEQRPSSGALWSWILNTQMRTIGTEIIFPSRTATTRHLPKPGAHWNLIHSIS